MTDTALATELADVRHALADLIDRGALALVGDPTTRDRYRHLGTLADAERALARGLEGSALAASTWNPAQSAAVTKAIEDVARDAARAASDSYRYPAAYGHPEQRDDRDLAPGEFTTEDVWNVLGPEFPVTKGIASKMNAAARAGRIQNTGRHTYRDRGGRSHARGQKLAIWRAL